MPPDDTAESEESFVLVDAHAPLVEQRRGLEVNLQRAPTLAQTRQVVAHRRDPPALRATAGHRLIEPAGAIIKRQALFEVNQRYAVCHYEIEQAGAQHFGTSGFAVPIA
jgi:hypothetical protein